MTNVHHDDLDSTTPDVTHDIVAEDSGDPDDGLTWSRFGTGQLPQLPKMSAVTRFYKAALEKLPRGFASALAHAVVDPAAARVALTSPTKLNVPGGIIELVDLDLWTPGVVPMPTNNRVLDTRVYPAAGVEGYSPPLSGPRSSEGETSTLRITAESRTHVSEQANRVAQQVLSKNNLLESIAARGIVMQTDVVYLEIEHADGEEPLELLATAEGSSRATNAHKVLGLENQAETLLYRFPDDRDVYRRFVNEIVSKEVDDPSLKTLARQKLLRRRNALVMPARVFLRFVPTNGHTSYARSLNGYLGMLHVDPPKPWSATGKAEAMAESVLTTLGEEKQLTAEEHKYLAGMMPPEEARERGFPVLDDEQSAYVLATLLSDSRIPYVDRGIKYVTAKKTVTAGRRTDVVAELALRPTRSRAETLPVDSAARFRAERMRAGYMRSARLSWLSTRPWTVTGRPAEEILAAAIEEHLQNAATWEARLELAALSMYHLTAWGVLRREVMGGDAERDTDKRGPQDLLKLMLEDLEGLQLLGRALMDGRDGRAPRVVDEAGELVMGLYDEAEDVIDQDQPAGHVVVRERWLRYTAYPAMGSGQRRRPPRRARENEHEKLARLEQQVSELVEELNITIAEVSTISTHDGHPLILREGWPADGLISDLTKAQSSLMLWTATAAQRHSVGVGHVQGDDLLDDEEDESEN